jgi:hypothetical protein
LSAVPAGHIPSLRCASSHGVRLPHRVLSSGCAVAPIGLARTLFVVFPSRSMPGTTTNGLDPEVSTPPPSRYNNEWYRESSLRLWLLYRVSPVHHRRALLPRAAPRLYPFRGFFPFSVFQSRGATYLHRFPNPWLRCALGFLLPSRRFAPLAANLACFIQDPLLGFTLRGFAPSTVPYALSSAAPLRAYPRQAHSG